MFPSATKHWLPTLGFILVLWQVFATFQTCAQQSPVTVQVLVPANSAPASPGKEVGNSAVSNAVVWLTPLARTTSPADQSQRQSRPRLTQRNKSFEPHLLVVQVGTTVDFPNRDPFFHNVFSLFDGKRFDLGLYEAGATNSARFDRAGVSFLFCNIHPEMSAVIVAVNTPYYGISDRSGNVHVTSVPDGKYEMHVWFERVLPDELKNQTRTVDISSKSRALAPIHLSGYQDSEPTHKNKYGQEYVPPPDGTYSHP